MPDTSAGTPDAAVSCDAPDTAFAIPPFNVSLLLFNCESPLFNWALPEETLLLPATSCPSAVSNVSFFATALCKPALTCAAPAASCATLLFTVFSTLPALSLAAVFTRITISFL